MATATDRLVLIGSTLVLLASGAPACSKSEPGSPCEATCRKEAACKLELAQGERMMGERSAPPDPGCMRRCENSPEQFDACEGKKKDCAGMLSCIGEGR